MSNHLEKITFTADADAIERAQRRAEMEHTTLDTKFSEWLAGYALRKPSIEEYRRLMAKLRHVKAGRKFTREELNER